MPVFGSFRMGAGKACVLDSAKAGLVYALRGNGGTVGNRPTVDDTGTVSLASDSGSYDTVGYTTAWKYWSDYTSSVRIGGTPLRTTTGSGTALLPLTTRADYSMMLRTRLWWDTSGIFGDQGTDPRRVVEVADNHSGGWGGTGLIMQILILPVNSTTAALRLNYATDSGGSVTSITSSNMALFGANTELLVTRGSYVGSVGFGQYTHFFINGAMIGSTYTVPSQAQFTNQVTMWVGEQAMDLNDHFLWNSCIATASYTPQSMPFC